MDKETQLSESRIVADYTDFANFKRFSTIAPIDEEM